MNRSAWLAGVLAALAAGAAGYWTGHDGPAVSDLAGQVAVSLPTALVDRARDGLARLVPSATVPAAARPAAPSGPVVYYRDPDGKPVYSLAPMVMGDGREFRAVHASEDVRFDVEDAEDTAMPAGMAAQDMGGHGMAGHDMGKDNMGKGGMAAGSAGPGPGNRRVLYYRNPMGLPDTSPTPKKDSMGMDYIPVYAGEDEGGNVVTVSPGKVQRTGVRTEVVDAADRGAAGARARHGRSSTSGASPSSRPAPTPSSTTSRTSRPATASARARPWSRSTRRRSTRPRPQLIANPGFDGARAQARRTWTSPRPSSTRSSAPGRCRRRSRGPRPADGLVLQRNAVEGMKAAAGDALFRIADISTMWVLADVPERDLAAVRVGPARHRPPSLGPGQDLLRQGRGDLPAGQRRDPQRRGSASSCRTRTARCCPTCTPRSRSTTGDAEPVVAVPDDAVIDSGERQVVLVDRGEGRFEPRAVKVGVRGEGYVEIRDGVADGDRVVTAANFLIDAESNLKAALQSLAAPKDDRQAANRRHAVIARLIAWSARNLVLVLVGTALRGRGRRAVRSGRCRSTPSPTSRTCRSSSTPSIRARRRRSSRTRSPIR